VLLAGIAELQRLGAEVTQAHLAAHCQTDVMMTSQVVRALEKAGLVERRQHLTDRRARFLCLTESGTTRLENAVPVARDADANFFAALGKKQDKLLKHLVVLNHMDRA
jgi:DNA-binding MarR family transcriptional regulator